MCDLSPMLARWRRRPVRYTILRGRVGRICRHEIRKVRHDHNDFIIARLAATPHNDALVVIKVHMDEIRVVDRKRRVARSELYETGDVFENPLTERLLDPVLVHRVGLLMRVVHLQVVLVGKLVASKDHGHTHGGE